MKRMWVVVAAVVLLFHGVAQAQGLRWERISKEHDKVLCSLKQESTLYCGTQRYLLRSADGGNTWYPAGVKGPVYDLVSDQGVVYAAGAGGLFRSIDGNTWERLYAGTVGGRACKKIVALADVLFVSTDEELAMSVDNGRTWTQVSSSVGTRVLSMAVSGQGTLCVVSRAGVYRRDPDGSWEKTRSFTTPEPQGDAADPEQQEVPEEDTGSSLSAADLVWSADAGKETFTLLYNGDLFESTDDGRQWESLPSGAGMRDAFCLAVWGTRLFAGGAKGVFEYLDGRWMDVSAGTAGEVNGLAADAQCDQGGRACLYVSTGAGLYRVWLDGSTDPAPRDGSFVTSEPSIEELFRQAIRYAEVNPGKIEEWRNRAARKAWLPELRVGLDRDTTDLWHWEGGSTTKEGDDILVRGKDSVNWDVSLAWDLSELVWSTDQTSIDVRSRLLVELRDDILDQVTRFYFERLRVKHELETLALEDKGKRFEKELKMRELAASLDALTGGYFSRNMRSL